jgi:hypothetical protein
VRRRDLWVHLGVLATSLVALLTSLEVPATSLGALQITVELPGKNIFVGNATGAPGIRQAHLESGRRTWNPAGAPGIRQVCLESGRCTWNLAGAPGIWQVDMESGRYAWNPAGAAQNHRYSLSFNDCSNTGIQIVFLSIYQYLYVSI